MKTALRWWPLKLALTGIAIWLVLRKVDAHTLVPVLRRSHVTWVLLCIAMQGIAAYLNAVRWKMLWNERNLPLHKYLYYVFVGYFFNFFLPSAVLSEAVRVVAFGRKYQAVQANIGIGILARAIGASILALLGMIGLIITGPELWRRHALDRLQPSVPQIVLLVAAVVFFVGVALFFGRRLLRMPWAVALLRAARDPKLVAKVFVLSLGIQAATLYGTYALFISVDVAVSPWHVALFISIIQFFLMLPISFGGIGIREYLNLLLFSEVAGISTDAVLVVSVLTYIPLSLFAGTGGLWMAFRRSKA